MDAIEVLGQEAANTAMRSAITYIRNLGMNPGGVRMVSLLLQELRARAGRALKAGLADAREAMAVGMFQVAQQTLMASMAFCGIESAKAAVAQAR